MLIVGADGAAGQRRVGRLQHVNFADEIGADRAEVEGAITGARGNLAAVVKGLVEGRAEAADGDFGGVARGRHGAHAGQRTDPAADGHARDALDGGGEVGIGKLADVFGGDRVDHAHRIALDVEAALQRSADAGDHDCFHVGVGFLCDRGRHERTERHGRHATEKSLAQHVVRPRAGRLPELLHDPLLKFSPPARRFRPSPNRARLGGLCHARAPSRGPPNKGDSPFGKPGFTKSVRVGTSPAAFPDPNREDLPLVQRCQFRRSAPLIWQRLPRWAGWAP